jgi:hypothetical protein
LFGDWRKTMIRPCLVALCLALAGPVQAEEPTAKPSASDPAVELCMETRVNGVSDSSFDCLNAQLRATMRRSIKTRQLNATSVLSANSAPSSLGLVTVAGEQLRLGPNFGKSAAPFRPVPPVFRAPVGPK